MTSSRHFYLYGGYYSLLAFILCIPAANFLIQNVGTKCIPGGPCLIPVAPGVLAPTGVLMIGIALVLRDIVQRLLGEWMSVLAILIGAALTYFISPALAVASSVTFLISELVDFGIFTWLKEKSLTWAIFLSSVFGLLVDSTLFLYLAFGSLDYIGGQILGKLYMVLLAMPAIFYFRKRIE